MLAGDHTKSASDLGLPFVGISLFYREGYTVMEMESGPYLSAVYELVDPRRHPNDEIVYLGERTSFPVGFLHYASDTPYSRRKSLLSSSLSYFGMDSTYACAIAIVRRIFETELRRQGVSPRPAPATPYDPRRSA